MSTRNSYDSISSSHMTDMIRDTEFVFENNKSAIANSDIKEIGLTTGPLYSASFFIGKRCQDFNDDYMMCLSENGKNGPRECVNEGKRVTRCAQSLINDLNKYCLKQFELHYQCLNMGNMEFKNCRKAEVLLNKCVFTNMGGDTLKKEIPGGDYEKLLHKQIYQPQHLHYPSEKAYRLAKANKEID